MEREAQRREARRRGGARRPCGASPARHVACLGRAWAVPSRPGLGRARKDPARLPPLVVQADGDGGHRERVATSEGDNWEDSWPTTSNK